MTVLDSAVGWLECVVGQGIRVVGLLVYRLSCRVGRRFHVPGRAFQVEGR